MAKRRTKGPQQPAADHSPDDFTSFVKTFMGVARALGLQVEMLDDGQVTVTDAGGNEAGLNLIDIYPEVVRFDQGEWPSLVAQLLVGDRERPPLDVGQISDDELVAGLTKHGYPIQDLFILEGAPVYLDASGLNMVGVKDRSWLSAVVAYLRRRGAPEYVSVEELAAAYKAGQGPSK